MFNWPNERPGLEDCVFGCLSLANSMSVALYCFCPPLEVLSRSQNKTGLGCAWGDGVDQTWNSESRRNEKFRSFFV